MKSFEIALFQISDRRFAEAARRWPENKTLNFCRSSLRRFHGIGLTTLCMPCTHYGLLVCLKVGSEYIFNGAR
jgi:hypothetical protein